MFLQQFPSVRAIPPQAFITYMHVTSAPYNTVNSYQVTLISYFCNV